MHHRDNNGRGSITTSAKLNSETNIQYSNIVAILKHIKHCKLKCILLDQMK